MSKSILLSIKPQWLAKILNGEKTIEVRKKFPKDYIGWVYLYCSKNGGTLCPSYKPDNTMRYVVIKDKYDDVITNEHIVARFWCDKVEEITPYIWTPKLEQEILKGSCLTENELFEYISKNNGEHDNPFFAIHISKLEIFDEPKYLCDFWNTKKGVFCCPLTKAPQNYCYIEGE